MCGVPIMNEMTKLDELWSGRSYHGANYTLANKDEWFKQIKAESYRLQEKAKKWDYIYARFLDLIAEEDMFPSIAKIEALKNWVKKAREWSGMEHGVDSLLDEIMEIIDNE